MSHVPPTPEELWARMLNPFEPEEELEMMLDEEMHRTLAMTNEEIRADLTAMGCDVAAIEREAREFFKKMGWRPARQRNRLLSVVAPIAILGGLADVLAPSIPELIPLAAHPQTEPAPVSVGAGDPAYEPHEDGGSHDTRSR